MDLEETLKNDMTYIGKKIPVSAKIKKFQYITLFLSEFVASFIFLFIGCLTLAHVERMSSSAEILHAGFSLGMALLVSVACCQHLSGPHVSLVITLTSLVLGDTPVLLVPVYILGQLLGSTSGFFLSYYICPGNLRGNEMYIDSSGKNAKMPGMCSAMLGKNNEWYEGLLAEYIGSAIMSFFYCGVVDIANTDKLHTVPILFGFVYAAVVFGIFPITGGAVNPIRTLIPAIFNRDLGNYWIYWVGPILASLLTPLFYRVCFMKKAPEPKDA